MKRVVFIVEGDTEVSFIQKRVIPYLYSKVRPAQGQYFYSRAGGQIGSEYDRPCHVWQNRTCFANIKQIDQREKCDWEILFNDCCRKYGEASFTERQNDKRSGKEYDLRSAAQ